MNARRHYRHVFVDANKRTRTTAAILYLLAQDAIAARPSPLQLRMLGELAVEVASTKMDVDEVADWIARILRLDAAAAAC